MSQTAKQRPPMGGFHHFGITVTDVEASADWYQRVLDPSYVGVSAENGQ